MRTGGGDFVTARRGREIPRLTMFARDADPGRIGGFGAHEGDGTQQELGEMAEGGGFLSRDAALREQAKDLSESAVHAAGGGEIAAGGVEFGKGERRSDDV